MLKHLVALSCLVHFSSHAGLMVSKKDYFSGNYQQTGTDITRFIASDLSVVDITNNLEFMRLDVSNDHACDLMDEFDISNNCLESSTHRSDLKLSATQDANWYLGDGYDLINSLSYYTEYYHWPGAYGAAPNYYSFYFDNKDNTAFPDAFDNEFINFANQAFGVVGNTVDSGMQIMTVDPKYAEGNGLMVGRESSPYGDFNVRWSYFGYIDENNSYNDTMLAPLLVRQWDGETFLTRSSAAPQNSSVSVSEPLSIALFGMGLAGIAGLRRRSQK